MVFFSQLFYATKALTDLLDVNHGQHIFFCVKVGLFYINKYTMTKIDTVLGCGGAS